MRQVSTQLLRTRGVNAMHLRLQEAEFSVVQLLQLVQVDGVAEVATDEIGERGVGLAIHRVRGRGPLGVPLLR